MLIYSQNDRRGRQLSSSLPTFWQVWGSDYLPWSRFWSQWSGSELSPLLFSDQAHVWQVPTQKGIPQQPNYVWGLILLISLYSHYGKTSLDLITALCLREENLLMTGIIFCRFWMKKICCKMKWLLTFIFIQLCNRSEIYHGCFQKPPPPLIPDMETKVPLVEDATFHFMREEGVLFSIALPGGTSSYWVVGSVVMETAF